MTKRERTQALRALYAQLPTVRCQRKCGNHCGPIYPADLEKEIIEKRMRRPLTIRPHPLGDDLPMCSFLTADGECGCHSVRPIICRLWGAVPEMPCPHGCEIENPVPEGKWKEFFDEALRIGGREHTDMIRPYVNLANRALRTLVEQ